MLQSMQEFKVMVDFWKIAVPCQFEIWRAAGRTIEHVVAIVPYVSI